METNPTTPPAEGSAARTILIVDDHKEVRLALRAWLGGAFPSHRFLEAESGEAAVELAKRHAPQVILMDVGLPGMNGIEAVRLLKAAGSQAEIVMLSIHEEPQYRQAAKTAGARAYISKWRMDTDLIPTLQSILSP